MKDVAWGVIHGEGTIVCKCDRCGKKEEYPFDNGHPDFKSFQKKLFGMNRRVSRSSQAPSTTIRYC